MSSRCPACGAAFETSDGVLTRDNSGSTSVSVRLCSEPCADAYDV